MSWLLEKLALRPDLVRGLRASFAFSVVLWICFQLRQPLAAQFAATAALSLSLAQMRGAYGMRVAILVVMIGS